MTTTTDILDGSGLPPLAGPDRTAERLLLIAHRGVDWDVWGGSRRVRYWDALEDYCRAATFAGPTLADWWSRVTVRLSVDPPTDPELRSELAALLAVDEQRQTLAALRAHAAALSLRVRIVSDVRKQKWQDRDRQDTLEGTA